MSSELEQLKLIYKAERKVFLKTLLAIDEQIDKEEYATAKYIIEQTYIILTSYPINESENKNEPS